MKLRFREANDLSSQSNKIQILLFQILFFCVLSLLFLLQSYKLLHNYYHHKNDKNSITSSGYKVEKWDSGSIVLFLRYGKFML